MCVTSIYFFIFSSHSNKAMIIITDIFGHYNDDIKFQNFKHIQQEKYHKPSYRAPFWCVPPVFAAAGRSSHL